MAVLECGDFCTAVWSRSIRDSGRSAAYIGLVVVGAARAAVLPMLLCLLNNSATNFPFSVMTVEIMDV